MCISGDVERNQPLTVKGVMYFSGSNCGNQERRLYFEEAFAAKEGSN